MKKTEAISILELIREEVETPIPELTSVGLAISALTGGIEALEKTMYGVSAEDLVKTLDSAKKDALYRILRKEHVSADICSHAVTLQKPLNALGIDKTAELYINGRYNNELPYWDNLESIINEIYMEDKYRDVDCI